MKSAIRNDDNKGRGNALLILQFEESDEKPSAGETFTVSVQAFPSRNYLQAPGSCDSWVSGSETYIPVDGQHWDGTELTLELGPYFTAAFEEKLHSFNVRGSIHSSFTKIKADTQNIIKPPRDMGKIDLPDKKAKFSVKQTADITLINRTDKSPGLPESPPPAVPEEAPAGPAAGESADGETGAEKNLPAEAGPAAPGRVIPPGPEKSKSVLPVLIPLVLIILALASAWYFLLKDKPEDPEAAGSSPETEETPAAVQPAAGGTPIEEARRLLREGKPDGELAEAVDKLDGTPGAEDAVFLLLRKLARSSPKYRMRFAEFYDPMDKRPTGSIQKNAKFAYDEYDAARKAGAEQAESRQEALLDWALSNEDTGDPGARALTEMLDSGR
ncbi:MAG: hypothetical protein LBP22_16515 [Deltaproteobacteria bacterium]|jgi:hypothetical protein|nr:hypothetical protein [Deltaproteobacteria bacterium]